MQSQGWTLEGISSPGAGQDESSPIIHIGSTRSGDKPLPISISARDPFGTGFLAGLSGQLEWTHCKPEHTG